MCVSPLVPGTTRAKARWAKELAGEWLLGQLEVVRFMGDVPPVPKAVVEDIAAKTGVSAKKVKKYFGVWSRKSGLEMMTSHGCGIVAALAERGDIIGLATSFVFTQEFKDFVKSTGGLFEKCLSHEFSFVLKADGEAVMQKASEHPDFKPKRAVVR